MQVRGYSLGIGINRGNQCWCLGCNNSYVHLTNRWQRNKRLRGWWNNMKGDQQVAWFRKWMQLDAKKRFEALQFTENTIEAKEQVEDEIDRYVPYDIWRL